MLQWVTARCLPLEVRPLLFGGLMHPVPLRSAIESIEPWELVKAVWFAAPLRTLVLLIQIAAIWAYNRFGAQQQRTRLVPRILTSFALVYEECERRVTAARPLRRRVRLLPHRRKQQRNPLVHLRMRPAVRAAVARSAW